MAATVKSTLGEDLYEQIRSFLQYAFPDAGLADDALVDGVLRAIYRVNGPGALKSGFPEVALPLPSPEEVAAGSAALAAAPSYPLYIANATHHRVRSMTGATGDVGPDYQPNVPFESEFVGHLPVVRVPLPQKFPQGENPDIRTQIGQVFLSSDHLVGSIDLITQKFGSQLGYTPGKVDLVTPARIWPYSISGSRFGAIACYVGYRNATDATPSFYILEAGMATGEPKTLYFAPSFAEPITRLSGYLPTAYSSPNNYYTGLLVMNGQDPSTLTVQAAPPNLPFYIQVSVAYQAVTSVGNDPFLLLAEAAARIALIGQNMQVPSSIPAQKLFAELALNHLPWVVVPQYGGSGTASPALAAS